MFTKLKLTAPLEYLNFLQTFNVRNFYILIFACKTYFTANSHNYKECLNLRSLVCGSNTDQRVLGLQCKLIANAQKFGY